MKNTVLLILVAAAIFFAACNSTDQRIVAKVNGEPILLSDLENSIPLESKKYDQMAFKADSSIAEITAQTLEILIQERLLLDEAKKKNINVSEEDVLTELTTVVGTDDISKIRKLVAKQGIEPDLWLRKQRNKLIIKKLIEQEVIEKIPVKENEITKYYNAHKEDFHLPMQYRARQILVDKKDTASEILKKLKNGEDFAKLAEEYSISPDASKGGDLGFFSTKDFPKVFSEICARLEKGETSDVKKTEYGYQIFQLLDKRPARMLPLDEVRAQIIDEIRDRQSAEKFALWFQNIRKNGSITIYQDALREVRINVQALQDK